MRKQVTIVSMLLLTFTLIGGCGGNNSEAEKTAADVAATELTTESLATEREEAVTEEAAQAELPDGVYTADFTTDSSMFHVNEACDGKGTLTVEDGKMTIHISLTSQHILNLYPGLAEDAAKDGAELLEPTVDTVTYSDGTSEEVYGFDVPVPALDEEFDLALIGTKGTWYDHKVSVSNPVAYEETESTEEAENTEETESAETAGAVTEVTDGSYTVELTFEGGSGKAYIASPATVVVADGKITATVEWSSPNYDYMIVDGEKYLPTNTDGNSVFEIPVSAFDEPMTVIGDTVAMSKPHEIEYTLTFLSDTIKEAE